MFFDTEYLLVTKFEHSLWLELESSQSPALGVPTNCTRCGQTATTKKHWHWQRSSYPHQDTMCIYLEYLWNVSRRVSHVHSPKCNSHTQSAGPKKKDAQNRRARRTEKASQEGPRITRDLFSSDYIQIRIRRYIHIVFYFIFCALLCAFCAFFFALPQVALHFERSLYLYLGFLLVHFPVGNLPHKTNKFAGGGAPRICRKSSSFQLNPFALVCLNDLGPRARYTDLAMHRFVIRRWEEALGSLAASRGRYLPLCDPLDLPALFIFVYLSPRNSSELAALFT